MATDLTTIQERIAQQLARQQETATGLRTTGAFIKFKNAQMKIDGTPIPNNMVDVRVLAAVGERTFYEGEYDADKVQVPDCYSVNSDKPHPEAASPQSEVCRDCPHNKWGTGPRKRGKACREGARIVVVPANVPLKTAPLYMAKIPITSLNTVTAFTSRCSQSGKMMGEFVTQLSVVEDNKSFFKVHLNIKEITGDMDQGELLAKQDEAFDLAVSPYPDIEVP
jgi:hypothetical protein